MLISEHTSQNRSDLEDSCGAGGGGGGALSYPEILMENLLIFLQGQMAVHLLCFLRLPEQECHNRAFRVGLSA